jgi:hypothetical protein
MWPLLHTGHRAPPVCEWILLLAMTACTTAPPQHFVAEPWPVADALFQQDPHWLGGDAIYSVDLGHERILWLFGDSFVATGEQHDRRASAMVRNTIAVQRGHAPATAQLQFAWRTGDDGKPAPFFPNHDAEGYWPLHGIRLDGGPLLLWQTRVRNTPGQGLGFAIDGWRILRVDNPDAEPLQWQWREMHVGSVSFPCVMGTSVWRRGDYVEVLGTRGNGPHEGLLCRFSIAELSGDAAVPQWWNGTTWGTSVSPPGPRCVLDEAGPECSLHPQGAWWLHVYSRGFGRSTVAVHTASASTGPWSQAIDVFTPPESLSAKPFVYAAKAHPELSAGDGWLAVSYAANAFEFASLFTEAGQRELYWPRFWRVRVR